MTLRLTLAARRWPMKEPFVISRGVLTGIDTLQVRLEGDDGAVGRGEGCGVIYAGETPATMRAEVGRLPTAEVAELTREGLQGLLRPGGARCALDAALWDLEAKRSGRSVFELAGVGAPRPLDTAYTIGIRTLAGYEAAGEAYAAYRLLKIKVGAADPVAAVKAVRRGAPGAAFIVDPNQAWSVEDLKRVAPPLADLGVVLLEQPIPVAAEAGLDGYRCPIPLCADELVNDRTDLPKAAGRFDVVNIKLDKTGGLTEALRLADAAEALGLRLMVGCMAGSSLAMAPALVLAQRCTFVDLDGPLLQAEDWPDGLRYEDGMVHPPEPGFWG